MLIGIEAMDPRQTPHNPCNTHEATWCVGQFAPHEAHVRARCGSVCEATDYDEELQWAWLSVLEWGNPEALRFLALSLDPVDESELGGGD